MTQIYNTYIKLHCQEYHIILLPYIIVNIHNFTDNHLLLHSRCYQSVHVYCLHILPNITPHILHRDKGTLNAADGEKKQVVLQPTLQCRQHGDSRHPCGRFVLICLLLQQFGGGCVRSFSRSQCADEYSKVFLISSLKIDTTLAGSQWSAKIGKKLLNIQCVFITAISFYPQSFLQTISLSPSHKCQYFCHVALPLQQPSHFTLILHL